MEFVNLLNQAKIDVPKVTGCKVFRIFNDDYDPVKALSKAAAAGQRIYHITPANQALTLPHIGHDSATMDEIRAALAVGKVVITERVNLIWTVI